MQARLGARIPHLSVILAAALGGCQTAGTAPDSSSVQIGTRFSVGSTAPVHVDPSAPVATAAGPTTPRVVLTANSSDHPTRDSAPEDVDSALPANFVADFTLATTVPKFPTSTESPNAEQKSPGTGALETSTPLIASAPSAPGGLGSASPAAASQMSLDAAIAISLDRNATLVSLRAGEPVAQAVLDVAEHYPFNPYVQVEVLPYARDPTGSLLAVRNAVYLSQTLELAHQQRYREASASSALNQVRWNIVAAELTNMATTEKLYFTALYQRDLRDLARRAASLNEELSGVVERRFQSALSKPGEEITARVSLRQSRKQADLAEANYRLALLALVRQLNVSGDRPFELAGRLEDYAWSAIDGVGPPAGPTAEAHVSTELAETLAGERPDVRAAQAAANVAQSNAGLARANTVQNIQVGPYYERDEFETLFFGFKAQMNLPIWDSGKPLARQREAECSQQVTNLNELRSRAQVEVQTALERYERARVLAEKERPNFSQSLSEDLARVKRQFEAGQADILNVFATQTSLLQEQRAYLDLLNELSQAAADVTLAAGLPPARFISGQPTQSPMVPAPPAAP
jgi:outer membrane protein, heavy metal efflux system